MRPLTRAPSQFAMVGLWLAAVRRFPELLFLLALLFQHHSPLNTDTHAQVL